MSSRGFYICYINNFVQNTGLCQFHYIRNNSDRLLDLLKCNIDSQVIRDYLPCRIYLEILVALKITLKYWFEATTVCSNLEYHMEYKERCLQRKYGRILADIKGY